MKRDVDQLTRRTFDVLVVGGGIYGLMIAYDAAQRGLDVALIERMDFGSGASFNHLRTIHGGLRYLQTLDVARARESVRERRTTARLAPHQVTPLSFVLPLGRSLTRGATAMRAGFLLDRIVAFDRNRGVAPSHRLAAGSVVSRAEALGRFPGLKRQGLAGAAVWQDYVAVEADRLTFGFALAAAAHGAALANYVEALSLLMKGPQVAGVRATDLRTGRELEIAAHATVNATGAAVDRLTTSLRSNTRAPMLKALNLVTSRDAGPDALGGLAASGRNLFMVPWRGRALFGTWESARACDPADPSVSEAEVAAFIGELNQAFPALDLGIADVTLAHRGLVPAAVAADGRATLEKHERIRDDAPGLVSVAGTKYTTARAVAERVVDRVIARLGRQVAPCRTAATPLPGGGFRDVASTVAEGRREAMANLGSDTLPHLVAAYGSRYRDVLELVATQSAWQVRLSDQSPVIGGELVWAARHEMVVTLADAVIRRTPLGALGYPGDAVIEHAAILVGAELLWSDERRRSEMSDVKRFYAWESRP